MKFQIISFVAALAFIAPALAAPQNDCVVKCNPDKYEFCPYGYVCCDYYCYKGDKCPDKDKDHKY